MRTYMVGGAVRDGLMGLPVVDRDWVVVGASPQEMIASGFLPVGKDFPVFLHPQTREEYALARTERKTARGYHGFAFHAEPDVTLEEDLARRDLTINAMARDERQVLVDPYGGQRDLAQRVLRHVTTAFREDPVRILRVARFAARFPQFTIAPETRALMREMVEAGEVDALVAERVWQEFARGLMEARPSRMLEALDDCGALARLLPEIHADAKLARIVDSAAANSAPLAVRFACLVHALGPDALRGLCERLRVPTECRELAEVVAREFPDIHGAGTLDAAGLVRLLERCDAFRKPQRFESVLLACECIAGADPYPPRQRLLAALDAARAVPTHEVAEEARRRNRAGPQVGAMIQQARIKAVAEALHR